MYEETWERGELGHLSPFSDLGLNAEANDTMRQFIHGKIRNIVDDPVVAETLCPTNHYFATKRPCLDTGYYETYNRDNVRLIDLQSDPIATITETGIDTSESMEFDAIVFATGFDAMTGAIVSVDITGRGGKLLRNAWAEGPMTYLGLMTVGFPNLYMITGPGSPSVLSNMMVSIEQHVDWISDLIEHMQSKGVGFNRANRVSPRALGAAQQRHRQPHAATRRRIPGTWVPMFQVSPRSFCRIPVASVPTVRSATKSWQTGMSDSRCRKPARRLRTTE